MTEYIKRENVLNTFNNFFYSGLAKKIVKIPSEDVAPVRHGHWIHIDYQTTICSVCEVDESNFIHGTEDWYGHGVSKFCPNCGAKMDEVKKQ